MNKTQPPPELFLHPYACKTEIQQANLYPSWTLTRRQLCDLEMLLNGAFYPLTGFLGREDYEIVLSSMRLKDGSLWPIPVNLDVSEDFASAVVTGDKIALRDPEGALLATMNVEDIWRPDKDEEATMVFGTQDREHAGVRYLYDMTAPVYLGGSVHGIEAPSHYDFPGYRHTPAQMHALLAERGWDKVVAFQTRNPMHKAHFELTKRAMAQAGARLAIQPVVGLSKPGDVDHHIRVRCYLRLLDKYEADTALLTLLPLAMRMGGPREALWHAIIRRNYGFSHFIVGRDHAGPGSNEAGESFYGPYEAQELLSRHSQEIGIGIVPFKQMLYVPSLDEYLPAEEIASDMQTANISGTEMRRRLREGDDIPAWFSFPEVIEELGKLYPALSERGLTVFFTGLSGSGKSTLARALSDRLLALTGRYVSLLDGDLIRRHISSELGFSREHRELNVTRIGYLASEITRHRGIAICAPIAPYTRSRQTVRSWVEEAGSFLEVHVATPLEVCEARDRKGLYAKARAGLISGFTGIDDPYEIPQNPELSIDTSHITVATAIEEIVLSMRSRGWLA